MKEKIKNYFKIWWIPLLVYFGIFGIFILGCSLQRDWIINLFIIILLVNVIGTIVASIIQIFKRRWYFAIVQIVFTYFIFKYFLLVFTYSPPDFYGVHKKIPKGIEIHKPLNHEPSTEDFENSSLLIESCSQPGIYCYYTNFTPRQLGYFYIKAFEITSNDRLSERRIKEKSKIKLIDLDEKIHSGEFTIYEGSWGDKYGSRIELWYKPYNNAEFKVTERNYIVEGWMR
ncbi:hypothetical protein [Hyunsoonleella rubra]|uniref:DUF4131 domain-containing protein n=1 Tax=Hyunsoonleella rubra TaxID=1737062 RepID=A0ABW5TAU4_9FLAO